MYHVKTRNWHCKRWVFNLLSITHKLGVQRGDTYKDGDGKFYLDTHNAIKAWLIWFYFMALSKFSGGWTYIVRPGKDLNNTPFSYKSIY